MGDEKQVMISVIIPVYNAEKYLHKCIDSVLSQTFSDFELLLINDGSKDRSAKICDEFAERDKRVKVIHKENGGVSTARNAGLDIATGKYICFIDSDDWVEKSYLKSFFLVDKNPETALVLQGFIKEQSNGEISKSFVPNKVFFSTEYSDLFFSFELIKKWPFIASKLFASELIRNNSIHFDEDVQYGEDLLFLLDYLLYSEKVILVNEAGYHYTYQKDSLSRFYYPYESENKRFESIIAKLQKIEVKFNFDAKTNELHEHFFAGYLLRLLHSLYRAPHKKKKNERVKLLKKHSTMETRSWVKKWRPYNSIGIKVYKFLFLNQFINMLDLYFVISVKKNRMINT